MGLIHINSSLKRVQEQICQGELKKKNLDDTVAKAKKNLEDFAASGKFTENDRKAAALKKE